MIFKLYEDIYDRKYGEPTTRVWKIDDLINFILTVASDSYMADEDLHESDDEVTKVVASGLFEDAIKQLYKKHQKEILLEIADVITKLKKYEITSQKSNHMLKGIDGHIDLHIAGGDLILLYKYLDDRTIKLTISEQSFGTILKLQDLINHKQLGLYNKKKTKNQRLNSPTKEFDIHKFMDKESDKGEA